MNTVNIRFGRAACAVALVAGLIGCASFGEYREKTRVSEGFSYYEPFDNATSTDGPGYLVGPQVAPHVDQAPATTPQRLPAAPPPALPTPDPSLPPSCLTCD